MAAEYSMYLLFRVVKVWLILAHDKILVCVGNVGNPFVDCDGCLIANLFRNLFLRMPLHPSCKISWPGVSNIVQFFQISDEPCGHSLVDFNVLILLREPCHTDELVGENHIIVKYEPGQGPAHTKTLNKLMCWNLSFYDIFHGSKSDTVNFLLITQRNETNG